MSFFFMGSSDEYEQEQLQERKAKGEDKIEESKVKKHSHKLIPPVSDEIKLILKRTIVPDLTYVHVKSNIDDYDKFYHTTGSESLNKELYENARKIKRIYKNYPEYLWAVKVYEEYIYAIIDKYGSTEAVRVRLTHGMLDDWLPPNPIYSTASPDYDLSKKGIITVSTFDDPDQEVDEEMIEELIEQLKISEEEAEEMEVIADVETDRFTLSQYKTYGSSKSNSSSVSGGRVNISDLAKLQTMFKQNITGETTISEESSNKKYLSKEPDKIREEFYTQKSFTLSEEDYNHIMNGEDIEEKEDLNKMVKDPITRKYMTLGEYRARDAIRVMGENGWNDIKLLESFNVGTEREREALNKKRKSKKKHRKIADDTMHSILDGMGVELISTNSTDDMKSFLFGDD